MYCIIHRLIETQLLSAIENRCRECPTIYDPANLQFRPARMLVAKTRL